MILDEYTVWSKQSKIFHLIDTHVGLVFQLLMVGSQPNRAKHFLDSYDWKGWFLLQGDHSKIANWLLMENKQFFKLHET